MVSVPVPKRLLLGPLARARIVPNLNLFGQHVWPGEVHDLRFNIE